MELFKLHGTIDVDNKNANNALDETSQKGQQTQSKMSKFFSGLGKGAAVAGKAIGVGLAAAGTAMGTLTVKAMNLGGELEQNMGGSEAVFKKYATNVQDTAKQAFSKMGLSTSDYLATANKMGALFQGAGFDIKESMDLSSDAMQRAADVASIMGIDTGDAMEAIAGAAKGNFTMMDNLGVAMNDTTLNAYALEKGINKTTQEMTNQEKIGLAMEMFMEKTAYAAGNYAKENDTLAGSLGTAKSALTNFLDGSGDVESLVTSFSNLANVIIRDLKKLAPRLVNGITDIINQVMPMLPPLLQKLLPVIIKGAVSLINGLVQALPTMLSAIMDALPALIEGVQKIINALIQALPQIIQALVSSLPTLIPMLVNALVSMIVTLCTMLPQIIQPIIDYLPSIIISIVNALIQNLPALIEGLITLVMAIVQALPQIIQSLVEALPTIIEMIVTALLQNLPLLIQGCIQLVMGLVQALPQIFASLIQAIPAIFTGIWNGIKNVFSDTGNWFGKTFANAKESIAKAWSNIKGWFAEKWQGIKGAFANVGTWFKDKFNDAKEKASNSWSDAKTKFSNTWSNIKDAFSNVGGWFKDQFSKAKENAANSWSTAKQGFSKIWSNIKDAFANTGTWFKNTFAKAKDGSVNAWSNIKSKFTGIKDKIASAFSNIKDVLSDPFGKAKDKIGDIVDRIKGFFSNLKLKFPNIKLPHFGVSPSGWKIGDLLKGSIPKLSIKWYAEAMNNPMIMTKPTVFGYDAGTGQLLGGGEAGSEVVSGTSTLMRMIQSAVAPQNDAISYYLNKIIEILATFFPQVLESLDMDVVLNDGVLVGRLAPAMNIELGKISNRKDRGR